MPRSTRIAVDDGTIHIFKEKRGWKRDLQVRLEPQGGPARGWIDFPGAKDVLAIDGLPAGDRVTVKVRRRRLLHRLRNRPLTREVELSPRPLRILLTGSGRCGTQTLAHYLDGMRFGDGTPVVARHEPLSEYVVPALIEGDLAYVKPIQTGLGHNVESAPYYALHPEAIHADRVVHVIRDGRRVVQSGLNRGWYQDDSIWNRLKPDFPGDAFARSCRLWRRTNETSLALTDLSFRLEDLIASDGIRRELAERLDIELDGRGLPHSNKGGDSSRFDGWTEGQAKVFKEICGPLMDRFYPGWETSQAPALLARA